MQTEQSKTLAVSYQSGSKCTVQGAVCQLINAAAHLDKEKSHLLFPQLQKKVKGVSINGLA